VPWLRRRRHAPDPAAEGAGARDGLSSDPVELRLRMTRQMAARLEAGVPCREVRIERMGDDHVALLLSASNREQWLMHVLAHARQASQN
jgi:hypothetical protein